ncbi:MAG: S41 family peptidase [Lachnospiraceae bacterium]|nr:S41 family peptidase [Lachnospiraceae bacterium]
MKKKSIRNIVKNVFILLLLLICIVEGAILKVTVFDSNKGIASVAKMQEIKALIDKYYLDDIDNEQLEEYTYKGLTAGLGDPYSVYYSKKEYQDFMESSEGVFSGIGAVLQQDVNTGMIKVVRTIKGSPAEKVGVKADDILYKIENKEISADEDLSSVVSKVKGKEGTKVNITFLRDGKEVNYTITRQQVITPTVDYEMLEDYVGYIQITEFDEVTVDQFKKALDSLNEKGMKKLVIDLRDNPGGLVTSVTEIADMILPTGMIVYTEDKNGGKQEYKATSKESFDKPLAVLINGDSASASEILAGAIQDYKKGTIVGTTSFGKGIVQNVMKLSDGSALKLTVSSYYTPKGRNIHKKGIEPDVKVELDKSLEEKSEIKKSEDNQLQKALQVLKEEK